MKRKLYKLGSQNGFMAKASNLPPGRYFLKPSLMQMLKSSTFRLSRQTSAFTKDIYIRMIL